jgi:hypothetical protein
VCGTDRYRKAWAVFVCLEQTVSLKRGLCECVELTGTLNIGLLAVRICSARLVEFSVFQFLAQIAYFLKFWSA